MSEEKESSSTVSRRTFIHRCAATTLVSVPVLQAWGSRACSAADSTGGAARTLSLDQNWLFGGKASPAAMTPEFDDASFARIHLPHCVTPLSWQKWNPEAWQDRWSYRRHLTIPSELQGLRLFLQFDRVMAAASPFINGYALPQHLGGFLPFDYEITHLVHHGDNVLSLTVDSRWLNVPPAGSPKGPADIDFLLPGGISGSVSLRAVPSAFISDVFAKPVSVLDANRRIEVTCTVDSAGSAPAPGRIEAILLDRGHIVARAATDVTLGNSVHQLALTLGDLHQLQLWDVEKPTLYDLVVTLYQAGRPLHNFRRRVGLRDARYEVDGFFLNGKRLRIFGLNRHELYPYLGFSVPPRLLRRDAEILRRQFNCNMVRCSHYPQSEAFLDACDEFGLMVWEEMPGWWYVGDDVWRDLLVRDVGDMVRRDRCHPSVIIWGVRANESANEPELYRRTRDLAKSLDDSRPTSGTMTEWSRKNSQTEWHQDVFAYDDYHSAPDGSVGIDPPLPGVPYLITETVGQCNYGGKGMNMKYRRAGDVAIREKQALFHAQAHSKAAGYPRCAGALGWCAFDYASLLNSYNGVKCPGIADVFRLPKLGASFYLSQVDPAIRPVIEPNFCWDSTEPAPGGHAAIFSNCDRLELFAGESHIATLHPDRAAFPHLPYPPFFADLSAWDSARAELRFDAYAGKARLLSRSFSADRSHDRLWLQADDLELFADGTDATRLAFGAVDKFGTFRATMEGSVTLRLDGPGVIVGDNPFDLTESGGVAAVWVRTVPNLAGSIHITAEHPSLGQNSVTLRVRMPEQPRA